MDIDIRSINELNNVIARIDGWLLSIAFIALMAMALGNRAGFKLPKLRQINPMIAIIGGGVLLRLYHINDAMWYDETFSAAMASISAPSGLFEAIMADVHPPLYYFVLWAVANILGSSEFALRLPALGLGIMSIYLMYHLSMALSRNKAVALIAAGIVAVLPAHIYYSVEARGYMLMVVLVQIGMVSSLKRWHWALVVSIALLPLTHSYGYLYAAALIAGWGINHKRRAWLAIALGVLPGVLWIPYLLMQTQNVTQGFWVSPPAPASVFMPLATMTTMQFGLVEVLITTTGALVLSTLGFIHMLRIPRRKMISWLCVIIGVPLMALTLSFVIAPIWLPRALLPVAMLMIPAWSLSIFESRRLAAWIAVVTIPLALVAFSQHGARDDIRSWINDCRGDHIYTLSVSTAIQAKYYSSARDTYIWRHADDMSQSLPHDIQELFGLIVVDYPPQGDICVVLQHMPYTLTAGVESHLFEVLFGFDSSRFIRSDASHYRFVTYEVYDYER